MTIYTPSHNEKDAKDILVPEVITEPLTGFKDDPTEERESSAKPVRVTYFPKHRRPVCFYLSFIFAVLVIVACGITGGVVFYRHMTKKVYQGQCGVTFYDSEYHRNLNEQPQALPVSDEGHRAEQDEWIDFVEEDIKVSESEMIEELHMPSFDEVLESSFLHDFNINYTSIIDSNLRRCFVMNLNRTTIAPPAAVIDLLKKLMNGFSLPKARVTREVYYSTFEPMMDLNRYGSHIVQNCHLYATFWLEKNPFKGDFFDDFMFGDSSLADDLDDIMYGMLSNQWDNPAVFKLNIKPFTWSKRLAA